MLGLGFAFFQIRNVRRAQRNSIVRQIFKDYLLLACDNPELAYPGRHLKFDFEKRTANGAVKQFEHYEWFLSYTLFACSEAVAISKNDNDSVYWEKLAQQQIDYHGEYLSWRTSWEARDDCYLFKYGRNVESMISNAKLKFAKREAAP